MNSKYLVNYVDFQFSFFRLEELNLLPLNFILEIKNVLIFSIKSIKNYAQ